MAENDGSATEKLTFLLIGAGIGATLALLFAPKSGRELRGDIADYTKKGLDAANEGARAIGDRAADISAASPKRTAPRAARWLKLTGPRAEGLPKFMALLVRRSLKAPR